MAKKASKAETAGSPATAPWRRVVAWLGGRWCAARAFVAPITGRVKALLSVRLGRRRLSIEVLLVDGRRRRRIRRDIHAALRQLRRAVAVPPAVSGIVVCQRVAASGRDLAGATHVCRGADGTQTALIRLALAVRGRELRDDEVLAVLAEQWLGLAVQQGGANVLVPVELPADPEPPAAGGSGTGAPAHGTHGTPGQGWSRHEDPLEPIGFPGPDTDGTSSKRPGFFSRPPQNGSLFGPPPHPNGRAA